MPTLTEKVNEVASFLAQVEAKRQEIEAHNQLLRNLFSLVDTHYEELRQLIDGSRPTSPVATVAPVVEQPAQTVAAAVEQPTTQSVAQPAPQ